MSDIPTYTDVKDLGLNMKVLQQINTPNKSICIQNITVNAGNEFDNIIVMINHYGGLRNFIKALYCYAIEQNNGHLTKASKMLKIPRQTLSQFRQKYLLSGGDNA